MRSIHLFLFLLAFSYTSAAAAQVGGTFETTGDMTTPRFRHGAMRLLNGKVLIVGGTSFSAAFIGERTVNLYDPAKAVFTVVGSTTIAGGGIPALLHDGRVLLIEADASLGTSAELLGTSAELYDPSTGTLTMTGNRTMADGRLSTPLDDGRVLIMGGGASRTRAELYDPSTQSFAPTNDTQGIPQTATSLANGKVLVTWNYWDGESAFVRGAALFDPSTSVFASIEPTLTYHAFPTATLLMSGKVLIVGGDVGDGDGPSKRAEIYDPETGTFTATGNLTIPRENHTATLLNDGSVLIAGGHNSGPGCCDNLTAAELYDPVTGTFRSTGSLATGRDNHVATLLENGEVLVTGGVEYYPYSAGSRQPSVGVLASAERYVPSVVVPVPIVTGLRLDRTNVVAGSSYSVEASGSNLTSETFFDIRFSSPGITRSAVVLNWQTGFAGTHDIPAGIASGKWTISGVRAHEIETDHTGSFVPVSAAITVLP